VDEFDGAVVGRTVYTMKRVSVVDTITVKLKKAIDFEGEDTRVRSRLNLEGKDQNKISFILIKSGLSKILIK
jgi:beta-galactosidase/beta-glucuronidase